MASTAALGRRIFLSPSSSAAIRRISYHHAEDVREHRHHQQHQQQHEHHIDDEDRGRQDLLMFAAGAAAAGAAVAVCGWLVSSAEDGNEQPAAAPLHWAEDEGIGGQCQEEWSAVPAKQASSVGALDPDQMNPGEARFREFASLEYEGESLMTPKDFLDSLVQERPRPRIKAKRLSSQDLAYLLRSTPTIKDHISEHQSGDPRFLRQMGEDGVLSFSDYLFLLSVLTRPQSGFRVAFGIMDYSGENTILKSEFSKFCRMASVFKGESALRPSRVETTLSVHFFGADGRHALEFAEFVAFIRGLQREVLRAEFLEYSRGLEVISEMDFANLLLRYTELTEAEQTSYLRRLERRLPPHRDRRGITFAELEQFFQLLNNMPDFALAFKLYPHSGHSLNRAQFARAAKISMGGRDLSAGVVDFLFAMFDKAGDDCLSYEEFIVVMKNRLGRQIRRSLKRTGWNAFRQCVAGEMRKAKAAGGGINANNQ